MRMKPLFPKKENGGKTAAPKKEKPTVDEQIMETGVRLRGLQRKYRIIIDRELRALRGSRARKQDNPKAVQNLKNAYYCLTIVNKAQERLREITTLQELSKAMNEMGAVLKLMNVVAGKTEKVKTRALQKGIRGMEKAAGRDDGGSNNCPAGGEQRTADIRQRRRGDCAAGRGLERQFKSLERRIPSEIYGGASRCNH